MLLRGHHGHLLALEAEDGQTENFALAPFSVIFYDSCVMSIMTHIYLFAFKLILIKNTCIMQL